MLSKLRMLKSSKYSKTFFNNHSVNSLVLKRNFSSAKKKIVHGSLEECLEANDDISSYSLVNSSVQTQEEIRDDYISVGRRPGSKGGIGISSLIIPSLDNAVIASVAGLSELLIKTPIDDGDYGSWVHITAKRIIPKVKPIDISNRRRELTKRVKDEVEMYTDGSVASKSTNVENYLKFRKLIQSRIESKHLDKLTEFEVEEMSIRLAVNQRLIAEETIRVNHVVEKLLSDELLQNLHQNKKLVMTSSDTGVHDSLTIFQSGPPGTGKGQTLADHLNRLRELDEDFSDYAQLSPDRKKKVVYGKLSLADEDLHHIGSYSHDESVMIYNRTLNLYLEKVNAKKPIPKAIVEQVYFWPENRNPFLKAGSALVNLSIRDPWNTVIGVRERGKYSEDRRITPTNRVLESYKLVSIKTPHMLKETEGERMVVNMYHTEKYLQAKFGNGDVKPLKPFAVANCENNRLYILDLNFFYEFISHRYIDTKALTKEGVLAYKFNVSNYELAEVFLEEFGHMEIHFIDPLCTDTSVVSLQANIVASLNELDGIRVFDSAGFKRFFEMQRDEVDALYEASINKTMVPKALK